MAGKKEYTLKINGVDKAIKDFTTLEDVVKSLDSTLEKDRAVTVASGKARNESKAALSEEEKAAKKLEETLQKTKAAREGANDAQIKANQALRDATREQTLRVQAEQASTNSTEAMRIELSRLKDEWKGLDVGTDEFRAMSEEIRVLNDKIKEAEQSTGDFRRNVGNYQSALDGLGKLSDGIDGVSKSSMGLAQGLLGTTMLMTLFGDQSEENAKQARELQKIIALLSIAQQVNTNILREGIVQGKLSAITNQIQAMQLRAKTAAEVAGTKGTIAATIAQKAFNAVASANPYVLLALALVAVGGAMSAYSKGADSSTAGTKKYVSSLTGLTFATKEARDAHEDMIRMIRDTRVEIDLVSGKITEYQASLLRIANEGADAMAKIDKECNDAINHMLEQHSGFWQGMLDGLKISFGVDVMGDLQKKVDKDREEANNRRRAQEVAQHEKEERENKRHNKEILKQNEDTRNANLNGSAATLAQIETNRRRDLGEAISNNETIKKSNKDRSKYDQLTLIDTAAINAKYDKERKAALKSAGEDAISKRKELTQKELETIRTAEDARIKLIQNSNELARKTLEVSYDRQIEDLRKRLAIEKDLTVKARAALNETIASLEKQKARVLENLSKEQANRALALQQEVEDSRVALIVGSYDRQAAEVNLQYDRQIEAYKKRLNEDKTLTEEQQKQITELILNTQTARGNALAQLTREQLGQQADQQLTAVEDALNAVRNKIDEVAARSKTGLNLIDVDATRKNLKEISDALKDYIAGLTEYQDKLKQEHEAAMANLPKGSPEYEAETQRYAGAYEDAAQKIRKAQKEIAENTKQSTEVQGDAIRDLFNKISDYAQEAVSAVSSVMDTWSMGLQVQIDDLNEQLDAVSERYEEAQKQREDAVKNVEDIEARLQASTGGTTEALKVQLQEATHARAEADREERRLAKEKEKLEADLAKKEKQMKRNDLLSQIAQTIANTAAGVAKAVSAAPLTFGLPWSAFVSAMGAVQVGIMTRQLTKLADGGEIKGPSHANGGVPIPGTDYEVEGGEFVVNKQSYGANTNLVKFINDTPRAISAADLIGVVPDEASPVIISTGSDFSEDRIIEAIKGINFRPVVSVTDINKVNDEIVTVEDLAGF